MTQLSFLEDYSQSCEQFSVILSVDYPKIITIKSNLQELTFWRKFIHFSQVSLLPCTRFFSHMWKMTLTGHHHKLIRVHVQNKRTKSLHFSMDTNSSKEK